MINNKSVILASLILVIQTTASADDQHYNNILIGDRAAGLGGAYTAISDDASGMFYNPAGIVYTENLQLSASANALHKTELVYKDVLNGGDWTRKSDNIVPNYFGMTTKLGDGYLGFSYAVTDFELKDQDSEFTTIDGVDLFVVNINNNDKVTKFGPSYALKLNEEWDIGFTLYWHERDRELTNNQFFRLPGGIYEWSNLYFENEESGYEPVIGVMWSPRDDLSLGLSVRQVFVTSSRSRSQFTCASNANDPALQPSQCISATGIPNDPTITTSPQRTRPADECASRCRLFSERAAFVQRRHFLLRISRQQRLQRRGSN